MSIGYWTKRIKRWLNMQLRIETATNRKNNLFLRPKKPEDPAPPHPLVAADRNHHGSLHKRMMVPARSIPSSPKYELSKVFIEREKHTFFSSRATKHFVIRKTRRSFANRLNVVPCARNAAKALTGMFSSANKCITQAPIG
jgi:hypothetical protein